MPGMGNGTLSCQQGPGGWGRQAKPELLVMLPSASFLKPSLDTSLVPSFKAGVPLLLSPQTFSECFSQASNPPEVTPAESHTGSLHDRVWGEGAPMSSCCSGFVGQASPTSGDSPSGCFHSSWWRSLLERGGVSQTHSLGADLGQPHLLSPVNRAFLPQPHLFIFLSSPFVLPPELEKAENEALAMRKQSKGLTKEYDRLLEEHTKLQVSPSASGPTCLLGKALAASWLQSLPVPLISFSAASDSASLGPNSQNPSLGRRAVAW